TWCRRNSRSRASRDGTLGLDRLCERVPRLSGHTAVCLREPPAELHCPPTVALGDLAHREDRFRRKIGAPLDRELPKPIDRDIRVLVETENVLKGNQTLGNTLRPFRVELGEELERIPQSLALDPHPVVVAGGRLGGDRLGGRVEGLEAILDQGGGHPQSRQRGATRTPPT